MRARKEPSAKPKKKLAPRTTVVLTDVAIKQAIDLTEMHKRSFSKEVEYLIEQEHVRLFKRRAA